jgi:hypothetical protein
VKKYLLDAIIARQRDIMLRIAKTLRNAQTARKKVIKPRVALKE